MDKLKMQSKDMTNENIERIEKLFPNVITEIRDEKGNIKKAIDFELLKQELSDEIVEGNKERYQLTWPGKKEAIATANTPINKTLRPVVEESLNWETTENLYIEGDNLEVLKLLQESYLNKIKCIYIDPPYNTGNDFIYRDNFTQDKGEYVEESGQVDEEGNRLFQNTEYNGRYHSDWLTMMYPRLKLARNLLSEDGVIFISIDDNEVHNLRKICDEIFGERNFVTTIGLEITKTQGMKVKAAKDGSIVKNYEYILCYSKNTINNKVVKNVLYDKNEGYDTHFSYYICKKDNEYVVKKLVDVLKENKDIYNEFKKYGLLKNNEISINEIEKAITVSDKIRDYIFKKISRNIYQEMACNISIDEEIKVLLDNQDVVEFDGYLLTKSSGGKLRQYSSLFNTLNYNDEYRSEYGRVTIRGNLWKGFYSDMMNVAKEGEIEYKNGKKPIRLIWQLAKWIGVKDEDIVLDFFSGSATTAHAIMHLNALSNLRIKYIMVQADEKLDKLMEKASGENKKMIQNIIKFLDSICKPHILSEIGKERIRRAGKKIKEETDADIDYGFRVFKVDESNMKDVYYLPNELDQNLIEKLESNIKEDRTGLDLLSQVMLEAGLELSLPIETKNIHGKEVHFVAGNSLIACFDENVDEDLINKIAKLEPLKVVFRDSSFNSCPEKINLEEIFKGISPSTEIKVL